MSSSGTFPERSPTPVTETWTVPTPCDTAASVFATPSPKSMWKCVSNGFVIRSLTLRVMYDAAGGLRTPERVDENEPVHVPVALDRLDQVQELVDVGARRVDREEDDFEPVLMRKPRRLDRRLDRALVRPLVGELDDVA